LNRRRIVTIKLQFDDAPTIIVLKTRQWNWFVFIWSSEPHAPAWGYYDFQQKPQADAWG
jgi:hypothetical protein